MVTNQLIGTRIRALLFSRPFAGVLAAAMDGGHVSVRRAAALMGLPTEGLEELFAVHRVEYVIDL